MDENLEHLGNVTREIIKSEDFSDDLCGFEWVEFTYVFDVDEDGLLVASSGYAYDKEGDYMPSAVGSEELESAIKNYRTWLSKDTDKGFMKMLFQFNRDSGQVQADFEYDDPMRWKVTPNNIDDMIEELRPNLGE